MHLLLITSSTNIKIGLNKIIIQNIRNAVNLNIDHLSESTLITLTIPDRNVIDQQKLHNLKHTIVCMIEIRIHQFNQLNIYNSIYQ